MAESDAKTVWSCPYWRVEEQSYLGGDGKQHTWYTARRPNPNTVHILAIDDKGMVPLLRQFRVPVGGWVWELPAGVCDIEGEDMADTANRELLEETGYHASEVVHLFTGTVSPGLTDELYNAYLCVGITKQGEGGGEGGEQIEVHLLPFTQVQDFLLQRAAAGEIVDSKVFGLLALAWRVLGEVAVRELGGDNRGLNQSSRLTEVFNVIKEMMARNQPPQEST